MARILVVEDEDEILELVAATLEFGGHTVRCAPDGETGLALARADPPDLVVLDVMLPGLDGYGVAAALATDPVTARVPVLILSARGQPADVAAGLATGARAYLVKPFASRELLQRVAALLAVPADRG